MSAFADHVEDVVADAERASEAIRREAEADAARRLAESRHEAEHLVAERTAELNRILNDIRSIVRVRLARIERESEEMLRAIEDAILGPRQTGSDPRTKRPGPASTAYPGTGVSATQAPAGSESESTGRSPSDGDAVAKALLRAAQMAGRGAAASEVEDALRQDVGGEEARAIVNQVFGD